MGNADQLPVWFDAPENTTVNQTGVKSLYVVFKRKTLPKESFPNGIIVRVQENGWMSDELVVDSVKTVWANRPGGLL